MWKVVEQSVWKSGLRKGHIQVVLHSDDGRTATRHVNPDQLARIVAGQPSQVIKELDRG
jgi:hypothetical protein